MAQVNLGEETVAKINLGLLSGDEIKPINQEKKLRRRAKQAKRYAV
jgi:hypothetical protein